MVEGSRKRAGRTRSGIVHAFNRLVLERRQRRIGVREVMAEARVGRSTFYDHFASSEALHMEALARPFALLADAAVGRGDPAATERLLAHFWEQRRRARGTLTGRTGEQAARLLARLVQERLEDSFSLPGPLAAQQLAAASLAPVRAWLLGEASSTPKVLAELLCRSGAALTGALREPGGT